MADNDRPRMRDVDHTHPYGGDATRRLYERGNEGDDENLREREHAD